MPHFIINFDLKDNQKNYKSLFNELNNFGALQLTRQTWLVKRHKSHAAVLRNHFLQFIFETDSLIVAKTQELAPCRTKNLPKDLPN